MKNSDLYRQYDLKQTEFSYVFENLAAINPKSAVNFAKIFSQKDISK